MQNDRFPCKIALRLKKICYKVSLCENRQKPPWINETRYLGIFTACHVSFRCSTDYAKRSFYRAANAIFAKVGRFASEEVILKLIV